MGLTLLPGVIARGYPAGHHEDGAALLHLPRVPQHSAFFKAKAYWLPVNVQTGLPCRELW